MNNVISPVTVDLVQPSIVRRLYAKQGDDGRGLLVTLTENGTVYDPTGSAARIFIQKSDGTQVYADCTITAGKILSMLPESALTAAGAADIELEMSTASQVITTPIAQLIVLPSNRSGIVSTAEFQALTTALEELEDIKQNVLTPTTTLTYTTPSSYSAPQSGDTVQTLFGKITKGLSDVFTSLAQKLDASKVIASTNITQTGFVMDGKTCSDAIAQLNSNIDPTYTANRALISNGNGKTSASDITSSELACLDGATENIPNRLSTMQSSLTSNNNRLSNVIGGIIPDSGVLLDWAKDDASRRIIWKVIGKDGFTGTPDDSSEWCIANYNAGTSPNRGIVIAYELDSPYRVQYRYYYNNAWIFAWQSIK